jgi:WD40 repeat protein
MALDVSKVITDAHDEPILCIAFNKQRRELFSGAQDGLIKMWEADTGSFIRKLEGHRGWVTDLMYYAPYRYLVSCGVDGSLVVWNDKGKEVYRLENLGRAGHHHSPQRYFGFCKVKTPIDDGQCGPPCNHPSHTPGSDNPRRAYGQRH